MAALNVRQPLPKTSSLCVSAGLADHISFRGCSDACLLTVEAPLHPP